MQVSCYLYNATEESGAHVAGFVCARKAHKAAFSHGGTCINHARGRVFDRLTLQL